MTKRDRRPKAEGRRPKAGWNEFFFAQRDARLCDVIRVGYAALLLVYLLIWGMDLERWFGSSGVLPADTARHLAGVPSLVAYIPIWICYSLLVAHTVALALGWHSRIQAICILLWLAQFDNRNLAIVDGEDVMFRLFAFYLALCPWKGDRKEPWALRLFQIQICVVYLSSAIEKTWGHDWTNGDALYYVARLDDWFGKLPVPSFVFDNMTVVKLVTYGVLALEWALPIFLLSKRTRRIAVGVGIAFHLSIDWTMNLFLFHWIMILGLLSFLEVDDLLAVRDFCLRPFGRARRDPDTAG